MNIEDRIKKYIECVKLEEQTYIGDVETAYECAYLQAQADLIKKLYLTEEFTRSKIAEMLGLTIMRVRNALNVSDWT